MSIDDSGLKDKLIGEGIWVSVNSEHPLVKLGNALPWEALSALVLPDLQATTKKGYFWRGRPLRLRIHLGVYVLQQLYNMTDRQMEYGVKDNAAYQLFCGRQVVKKWHCPDHTKIEEFRSRLSPETQHRLANELAKIATKLGFANPEKLDIDSTVQEANMAYPSDIHLLTQLGVKARRVWAYMQERFSTFTFEPIKIDLKDIKQKARRCYFSRTKDKEIKDDLLSDLWSSVFSCVIDVVKRVEILDAYDIKEMPWNIRRLAQQLRDNAHDYFVDVCKFLNNGVIEPTKRLSFQLKEVACFNKQKNDKKYQFGRNFQLGRIGGNFLLIGKSDSVRMADRKSLPSMVQMHKQIFPETISISVATDKGYYSKQNVDYLEKTTGSAAGMQKPCNVKSANPDNDTELINRRAGIEPLIGHAKQGGQLGRSRMKYDHTTESAGYAAILGFNGRQLIRYLMGKAIPLATITA
jgi:transposase, IS5 family